jgi:hypothetical protein
MPGQNVLVTPGIRPLCPVSQTRLKRSAYFLDMMLVGNTFCTCNKLYSLFCILTCTCIPRMRKPVACMARPPPRPRPPLRPRHAPHGACTIARCRAPQYAAWQRSGLQMRHFKCATSMHMFKYNAPLHDAPCPARAAPAGLWGRCGPADGGALQRAVGGETGCRSWLRSPCGATRRLCII